MLVNLRAPGVDLAAVLRRHVDKRIRARFASATAEIDGVTLTISDVNGPRGGVDLCCAITLDLSDGSQARAEATDADVLVALGRALALARRSLRRDRQRRRQSRRQDATGRL